MVFLSRVAISEGLDGRRRPCTSSRPSRAGDLYFLILYIEAYLYSIILSRSVLIYGHTVLRSNATSIALRDAFHVACCDWSMILVDITPTRLMK